MEKLTAEENLKLIVRIIDVLENNWGDGPGMDGLIWRTDNNWVPVEIMINCNDLFLWGCADCEYIDINNIDLLESTVKEIQEMQSKLVDEKGHKTVEAYKLMEYALLLFVARYREQRPQVPYYKHFPEQLKPLFDACGSEIEQYASEAYYDAQEERTGKKLEWRAKYKV